MFFFTTFHNIDSFSCKRTDYFNVCAFEKGSAPLLSTRLLGMWFRQ